MRSHTFVEKAAATRGCMADDELVEWYRSQASESIDIEAEKRLAETIPPVQRIRLQAASLSKLIDTDKDDFLLARFVRLGAVAAALQGHGGGIDVVEHSLTDNGLDLVLDLTGACLSCGAAPGTLTSVKNDLEKDPEIFRIRFSTALLDTFDELGREFILKHGDVEFVDLNHP